MAARGDPVRDYFAVNATPTQSFTRSTSAVYQALSEAQMRQMQPPSGVATSYSYSYGTNGSTQGVMAAATATMIATESGRPTRRNATRGGMADGSEAVTAALALAASKKASGRKPRATAASASTATKPIKALAVVNEPTPAQQQIQNALNAASTRLTRTLLSRAKGALSKVERPGPTVPAAIVAASSAQAYYEPPQVSPPAVANDLNANGHTDDDQEKNSNRICTMPGCVRRIRSKGLCKAHGGGRRCTIQGCERSSQSRGLCIRHGGGTRCTEDECTKAAQSNGLCKAHGGGLRCQFERCTKATQGGGYCRNHGGGQRCGEEGCDKGAQRGGFCASHGGTRFCQYRDCNKQDRGGGLCAEHGGGKRCNHISCFKPARRQGLCHIHASFYEAQQAAAAGEPQQPVQDAPVPGAEAPQQQEPVRMRVSDQFADI